MLAASLMFGAICLSGDVSTREGWFLLAALLAVSAGTARATLQAYREQDPTTPLDVVLGLPSKLPMIAFFIVIGIAALPFGADLLVESAVEIAERFDVTETVIGLTIVAVGTSLPEVATSIVAAFQKRTSMAVGTIVGSNAFNILGIMGVAAVVSPGSIPVSGRFLSVDLLTMLVTSSLLVALAWIRRPVGRRMGAALVATYVLYLAGLLVSV
jgi:cation:H+ antiporter